MSPITVSGVVFAFAFAAFGCAAPADEAPTAPRDWASEPGAKKPTGNGATPGETTDVPAAATEPTTDCTPKTCADGESGDDGCGGMLSCPTSAACTDTKESNNSKDSATDLGAMTDSPASSKTVADLTLGDNDEDWFTFKVTDGAFGGNPQVDVSVSNASAEVSVFFVCESQPDFSTCVNAGDTADTTVGKGCRAKGKVSLTTNCSGITETGTAFVRVKKSAADQTCTAYTLTVNVD